MLHYTFFYIDFLIEERNTNDDDHVTQTAWFDKEGMLILFTNDVTNKLMYETMCKCKLTLIF